VVPVLNAQETWTIYIKRLLLSISETTLSLLVKNLPYHSRFAPVSERRLMFAGQAVGIKEVHDDIWLVSFMDYDLGYFDLETRVLEPLENPFGPKVVTYVAGTFCYPCVRVGPQQQG
jgi:hypothetical protein